MEWIVAYYPGSLPLTYIDSSQQSFDTLPTHGVISLTATSGSYSHTLTGYDNYWLSGSSYGAFNNTGSVAEQEETARLDGGYQEVVYEGMQMCKYTWETEHMFDGELPAPDNVTVIVGVMVSDEEAQQIGLL